MRGFWRGGGVFFFERKRGAEERERVGERHKGKEERQAAAR